MISKHKRNRYIAHANCMLKSDTKRNVHLNN